jgi:hypothetical protein
MRETIDLEFIFEFGKFNNRSMAVEGILNDNILTANIDNPKLNFQNLLLPAQLKIKFLGKTFGKDTEVDSNGNIIKDMYVKIIEIKVDNLIIPKWVIEKKLFYVTETGETLNTSYIGFNGTMNFDIPENNSFAFYRRLNKDG